MRGLAAGVAVLIGSTALIGCAPATPPQQSETSATINPKVNVIAVTHDDRILWNGKPVSLDQLQKTLIETANMAPEPELRFEPSASASYELSADALMAIKASGVTNFGFVGNEKHVLPPAIGDD